MSDGIGTTCVATQKALDNPRFLIDLLGPEQAAAMTRPLTNRELELVSAGLARYNGDPVAALNGHQLPQDV